MTELLIGLWALGAAVGLYTRDPLTWRGFVGSVWWPIVVPLLILWMVIAFWNQGSDGPP